MLKTVYKEQSAIRVLHSGGRLAHTGLSGGTELLTICGEQVHAVDARTGSILQTFGEPQGGSIVTAVAASAKKMLCIGTADLQLSLYNLDFISPNFTLIKAWAGASNTAISAIEFDSVGERICTACADGSAKVWNVATFQLTHSMQNSEGVITTVTFLDLGNAATSLVAFGSFEGKVTIWDLDAKKKLQTISENVQAIDSVVYLPTIKALVVCGLDRRIVCLQRKSAKALLTVLHSFVVKENVTAMCAFDGPLCATIVTASQQGQVAFYNIASLPRVSQVCMRPPEDLLGEGFTSVTYSPASNELLLVSEGHNILAVDGNSGTVARVLMGFMDQVLSVQLVTHNEKSLMAASINTATVHLFPPGECVSVRRLIGHSDTVLCCALSACGRFLATGAKDTTIRVWDSAHKDFRCVAVLSGHTGEVTSVAFTTVASSSLMALVSVCSDESMRVWVLNQLRKKKPKGENSDQSAVGPITLTCPPEHTVERVHNGGIFCAKFSPSDNVIATGGRDKLARLWTWNSKNGPIAQSDLRGHKRAVYTVSFSPAERLIATGSGDKTIKVWNTTDGSCVRTMQGHENSILFVEFFNKGLQIVSCGGDGIIKAWAVSSAACVATLDGHEDKIWCLSVIKDGEGFLSGGADASIVEWRDITEAAKQEARDANAKRVVEVQELENCLRDKRFEEAFLLALRLNHPKHLHDVITKWPDHRELVLTMRGLSEEDLKRLCYFCRDWLLVSRRARVAHIVLNAVLKSRRPLELLGFGPWAKEVVEACQSYTQKYYNRVCLQLQDLHYLDFLEHCANPTAVQKRIREDDKTDAGPGNEFNH